MFLAIPLTAICKVVFDRVPALEPFGYVLGSDDGTPKEPSTRKGWSWGKARVKKDKA
jgi:hypothetical protein